MQDEWIESPERPEASLSHELRLGSEPGRRVRVGGIDYLNSRPLLETLQDAAPGEIELLDMPPSELARRLESGDLDVALIPVAAYLTSPPDLDYRIVPGPCISSCGAVESIRLYHRVSPGEVKTLGLDRSSMSSVLLTRLLFRARPDARWQGAGPEVEPESHELEVRQGIALVETSVASLDPRSAPEAVLLIGDAALRTRPAAGWKTLDLGLEWTRWTGLPFVYACWVTRGLAPEGLVECLRDAARTGVAAIDRIVRRGPLPGGMNREQALRYLVHVIGFRLGERELRGLERFRSLLVEHDLVASPRELEFLPVSDRPLAGGALR